MKNKVSFTTKVWLTFEQMEWIRILIMPKAARLTDTGSGHECFPPSPVSAGSPDVIINGLPAARVGDTLAPHACSCGGGHGTHSRRTSIRRFTSSWVSRRWSFLRSSCTAISNGGRVRGNMRQTICLQGLLWRPFWWKCILHFPPRK